MKKAKIICTIGPAVDSQEMISSLINNGMDCARLNFSHGTLEDHKKRIDLIKKLRSDLDKNVSILVDTKGPEIRVGNFENQFIELNNGDTFILTTKDISGTKERVSISYKDLPAHVKPGTKILIDDGKVLMNVIDIKDGDIICKVIVGGIVKNHKSINLPDISIPMPFISIPDKEDILFSIEQDVDFIAASFVRTQDDVVELRKFLDENGGYDIQLISKIENSSGINNIDKIIDVSDGIMVARGDMGVEIQFIKLPAIQKNIIKKACIHGKIIITATQMLETMTDNPIPTRAEVSDVANAIYDGSTVVMLSGETASGKYPIETLKTMSEIIENAEANIDFKDLFLHQDFSFDKDIANTISLAACNAAYNMNAKAIVVITRSGKTARLIANYRPACAIIAATVDAKKMKHLSLVRAVHAVKIPEQTSSDLLFEFALEVAKKTKIIEHGDTLVIVAGSSTNKTAPSDMLKVITV